jgi:hypothetical protein
MIKFPTKESIEQSTWTCDHYIDLNATSEDIWPWLAQMGNGRAGWYSYDWIDNLGKKSLLTINPKFVQIQKGQSIPFFIIEDFLVNEFITFKFGSNTTVTYLLQRLDNKSRLWTRLKVPKASWILKKTLGPAHKIMQDKQFLEIKKRVEKIL